MPRNSKAHKKSLKKQVDDTHRYCLYCKAHCNGQGFNKHQAACKIVWQLQCRQKSHVKPQSLENHFEKQTQAERVVSPIEVNFHVNIAHAIS